MTRRRLFWGSALWLAAAVAVAAAADVKVMPVVTGGRVFASFSAPAAFTPDTREVVQSGLPVTFTFTVELRRSSSIWFDHTLGECVLASSVKYDNLTRLYQVSKLQEGHVTWSDRTDQEAQMRTWVTVFDSVPLEATEALEPNADYYVRVRLRATPRRTFSIWPFGHDDGAGRADFTFIR